jgi:hypothetical protein
MVSVNKTNAGHRHDVSRRWSLAAALALTCAAAPLMTAASLTSPALRGRAATPAAQPQTGPASLPSVLPGPASLPSAGATSAAQAILINATIPFSRAPIIAAEPFSLGAADPRARDRALNCLTDAIYYEAALEPTEGQRAVAQVVLNRVRHPAFPKTVCGVVFQGAPNPGCQFTFACDGSLSHAPAAWAWARARAVAQEALNGRVEAEVGESTHYHAQYVAPGWGGELAKVAQLGAHIFYRWNGGWGLPGAFSARYAAVEPAVDLKKLAAAVTAAPALPPVVAQNEPPEEPHAVDDVGGRVQLGHGWTPDVPSPPSGALERMLSAQGEASKPSGG